LRVSQDMRTLGTRTYNGAKNGIDKRDVAPEYQAGVRGASSWGIPSFLFLKPVSMEIDGRCQEVCVLTRVPVSHVAHTEMDFHGD